MRGKSEERHRHRAGQGMRTRGAMSVYVGSGCVQLEVRGASRRRNSTSKHVQTEHSNSSV